MPDVAVAQVSNHSRLRRLQWITLQSKKKKKKQSTRGNGEQCTARSAALECLHLLISRLLTALAVPTENCHRNPQKLKCKAAQRGTLMEGGIKPSEEWMCAGGGDSDAPPTGNCASYLLLPPPPYHHLVCHTMRRPLPHILTNPFPSHFFFFLLSSLRFPASCFSTP